MDFFEQQERSRRQTRWLLAYFALAVAVIIALGYIVFASLTLPFLKPLPHGPRIHSIPVAICWLVGEALLHPADYLRWTCDPHLFGWFAMGAVLVVALGSLYKIRQLAAGGSAVAELLGGRCLAPDTTEQDEQKLLNVVEEMAIAAGMPVPEIYVLDAERGINAFAAGHTQSDVAIGVTRGCLKLLNRDELQGMVAHEFSHILNGDTRLNMRLMGIAHGVLWPVIVGRTFVRGSNRPAEPGESVLDEEASITRLPFILIGYLLLAIPADRSAVRAAPQERHLPRARMAGRRRRRPVHSLPAGIAGALKKIGGLYKQAAWTPSRRNRQPPLLRQLLLSPLVRVPLHPPATAETHPGHRPGFRRSIPQVKPLPPSQFEREQQYEQAVGFVMAVEKTKPDSMFSAAGSPLG
jgi:Zn-dependent protease with chaperone function